MPVITNLSQYVGTDAQFQFTVKNADGVTPTDLTAWVAVSFVVHLHGDPNITYITKTVGSGVVFTNRLAGVITVTVNATDVTSMPPGLYQWRLERTDSGSDLVVGIGLYTLLPK